MTIEISKEIITNDLAVMTISGRMNAATTPEIKQQMKSLLETGHKKLVLDLKDTTFIDSSGLSVIVTGLKQTREAGGFLRLAGLQLEVQSIFKLTMLDRVFEMYPDVESAMKS
jgi:anti-sigma B factor antagonist